MGDPNAALFLEKIEAVPVTVGRIVRYLMPDGRGVRAAIVTRVWNPTLVNLFVFLDASDDYAELSKDATSLFASSVGFGTALGQWSWPIIG